MEVRPTQMTQYAIEAAKKAALIALDRRARGLTRTQKSAADGDFFTQGDIDAQKAIEAILPTQHNGAIIGLLGEEQLNEGRIVPENAKLRWVVDPVDGTKPYDKGEHYWGVSIALQEKKWAGANGWGSTNAVFYRASAQDTPTALKGKVYWAEKGKGAYAIDLATGQQRRLSRPQTLTPLAEFESTPEVPSAAAHHFTALAAPILKAHGQATSWRRSICHATMEMLEGERSAVVQGTTGPFDWDVAALSLLVPEAGAQCTIVPREVEGGKQRYSAIMAWDQGLNQELVGAMEATYRQVGSPALA